MDEKTLVSVRNRNNGFTGYQIPDKGIWRNFAPGETKKIPLGELQQLQYQPGGEYELEHCLVVEDTEALKALNMTVEPEYNYTREDVKNLLLNGTLDQLKDCLDFAPQGVIDLLKDVAVSEEIPDIRKRDIISEATGFNINNAINVNHIMAVDEDSTEKAEPKKERRVAPSTNSTGRRTAAPATPNYKVVDNK